ncbi:hypothetical protein ARHIZOSPH14_03190 [Agromyces rhizosphaerae]|uniref:Uncharacterized protein n=1 Tax=Agromyces rhizosphaerae TaxID=88374 RepID=A0A9W6CVM9_9MICO|nr:hypothetical protein [Agromyces rhizosphaerae]GLI26077.1 hypothetical protein ARHIZOSPH14_03190 [Agromyces rhizosphaerae]
MTILLILVLAAVAAWGVVETLRRIDGDGYGRPEIRDRIRHIERRATPRI